MTSPWNFLTRRFAELTATEAPQWDFSSGDAGGKPSEKGPAVTEPRRPLNMLDGIGQRDELLRVRMSELGERLEDLRTLGEDFAQILAPMEAISSELPFAKARLLELEALLGQEVETSQSLRREVDDLSSRISAMTSDLSGSQARAARLDAAMREREATVEELRISLRERSLAAEEVERQLQAETERSHAAAFEMKTLRGEMQSADQALLDADRRLAELTERRSIAEGEAQRFQRLAEELNTRLVSTTARNEDLDQALEDAMAAVSSLEIQLTNDQAVHQRAQAQYEAEITAARAEQSNLAMKTESLAARHTATEQILGQVRAQLREKEEALRVAERALKESAVERVAIDRRLESLREDVVRRDQALAEAQRAQGDFEDRSEMLARALSAKEAALEGMNNKVQHLSDRIDALTLRYERERQTLESANRRLLEELQNERAERTLAQGALDIARESRLSLQRQNETLKRAARARQGDVSLPAELLAEPEPTSNVAFFPAASERKGDDAR